MWKSAYVGVCQLLNWEMHSETLKFVLPERLNSAVEAFYCLKLAICMRSIILLVHTLPLPTFYVTCYLYDFPC